MRISPIFLKGDIIIILQKTYHQCCTWSMVKAERFVCDPSQLPSLKPRVWAPNASDAPCLNSYRVKQCISTGNPQSDTDLLNTMHDN